MNNSNYEMPIPALTMWKMFSDTVPILYNTTEQNPENIVQHLTKLISSDQLLNIFIFSRPAEITNEDYEVISDKYKSFTVWLLGRFFHFLSVGELQRFVTIVYHKFFGEHYRFLQNTWRYY